MKQQPQAGGPAAGRAVDVLSARSAVVLRTLRRHYVGRDAVWHRIGNPAEHSAKADSAAVHSL
jgi:hypothetical protein